MNLAMQTETPFIELFKHGIETPAYEDYLNSVRKSLEEQGIRTDVFTSRLPTPLMCVWSDGQRTRLQKRAEGFERAMVQRHRYQGLPRHAHERNRKRQMDLSAASDCEY